MTKTTAVILGSSGGKRYLDSSRSIPSALSDVDSNRPVLSWIQNSLKAHEINESVYIGGYHIEKVIEKAPNLSFIYHHDWNREGELGGLRLVQHNRNQDFLIIKGNIVLTPEAVECLLQTTGGIVSGTCESAEATSEIGAILVRSPSVGRFFDQLDLIYRKNHSLNLEDLINSLDEAKCLDLADKAAPIENRPNVMRLVFKGKARTLEQLKSLTTTSIVLGQVRFSVKEWETESSSIIQSIQQRFDSEFLVVRSSSRAEDLVGSTGAGKFESVLGVATFDSLQIKDAVETVIKSYSGDFRSAYQTDEVLVQPQITDVISSGVMFTRDLETLAPYITITIDRQSNRSDVITSGAEGEIDTYYYSWGADRAGLPVDIQRVIDLAKEMVELTHLDALDIEFSFDTSGNLYLFQVRPMRKPAHSFALSDQDLLDTVSEAHGFVSQYLKPHPFLCGDTTVFGNMPDWNPAEMIGKTPRPLSLSLYQSLIGDFNWAKARADIGYRDVTPEPLVVSIGGKPYIDVRASLNSFLPAELPKSISGKWLNNCVNRLSENPELHDKLEFEILPTCYAFDWDVHAQRMLEAGLDREEIDVYRKQLCTLTTEILAGRTALARDLLLEVEHLELMRQRRLEDGAFTASAYARRVYLLLVDCGRFGLRPFSILARYAFIALALLKSLVSKGVLKRDEMDLFLQSIPTVAGEFTEDLAEFLSGSMSDKEFIDIYGHLRPNSYEITSANYADAFDRYIRNGTITDRFGHVDVEEANQIVLRRSDEIDKLLEDHGLRVNTTQLFGFMRSAIAGREKAKFEFMKCVNSVLDALELFGKEIGLNKDQLSHLRIDEILQFSINSMNGSTAAHLKRLSSFKEKQMEVTRAFKTPDLIRLADDVKLFRQEFWKPNFVTQHCIQADVVDLVNGQGDVDLAGKIVLIQAADPGYDWIFGHNIAGLITEYGGIGSHMAIRAAEFSLPAAIGCGSAIFEKMRKASRMELDCANEAIRTMD